MTAVAIACTAGIYALLFSRRSCRDGMRGKIGVAGYRQLTRHCRDGERCQWPQPNAPRRSHVSLRRYPLRTRKSRPDQNPGLCRIGTCSTWVERVVSRLIHFSQAPAARPRHSCRDQEFATVDSGRRSSRRAQTFQIDGRRQIPMGHPPSKVPVRVSTAGRPDSRRRYDNSRWRIRRSRNIRPHPPLLRQLPPLRPLLRHRELRASQLHKPRRDRLRRHDRPHHDKPRRVPRRHLHGNPPREPQRHETLHHVRLPRETHQHETLHRGNRRARARRWIQKLRPQGRWQQSQSERYATWSFSFPDNCMVENGGRLYMLAELAASTRPARCATSFGLSIGGRPGPRVRQSTKRPGSVARAARRRRVRWPSWWRDQHPRSASDCSERAHGCLPQCRLPKPEAAAFASSTHGHVWLSRSMHDHVSDNRPDAWRTGEVGPRARAALCAFGSLLLQFADRTAGRPI
jgi:hypothetical protein